MKRFTMEYEIDRKRLEEDGGYSYEDIMADLDRVIKKYDLVRKRDGLIEGKGNRGDFAHFGRLYCYLKAQEWLILYATKWLFIEDNEVEDALIHIRNKKLGVA